MDSASLKVGETLDFIVQFLRAEGFYAAEEALMREIENRCSDEDDQSPEPRPVRPSEEVTVAPERESKGVSLASGVHNLPSSGPDSDKEPRPATEPLRHVVEDSRKVDTFQPASGQVSQEAWNGDVDEYSDEYDAGYTREYVTGQAAFIEREIDQSDGDHSMRGLDLYHQAQSRQASSQGELAHSEDGAFSEREPPFSTDEGAQRNSQTPLSQVSESSQGKRSSNTDGVIKLMDPVNPVSPNISPQTSYVVPPLEHIPELSASHESTPRNQCWSAQSNPPSGGPRSHALSHISSDMGIDSPLLHEASLGANLSFSEEAAAAEKVNLRRLQLLQEEGHFRRDTSTDSDDSATLGARPGLFPLNLIGTFSGALGKVFGRNSSKEAIHEESSGEPADTVVSRAGGESDESAPMKSLPSLVGTRGDVRIRPPSNQAGTGSLTEIHAISAADQDDDTGSEEPGTPKSVEEDENHAQAGDLAFSFPVTPQSEAPVTAEPGRVFGNWPSFGSSRELLRKPKDKGDGLMSRASSDYEHSTTGYSTDEGLHHHYDQDWSRPSSRNEALITAASAPEEAQAAAPRPEPGASNSSASQEIDLDPSRPPSDDSAPSVQPAQKTPLGPVPPLDPTISLPTKSALDFAMQPTSSRSLSDKEVLHAYKPSEGEGVDFGGEASGHSGDLTVRTMETAAGNEEGGNAGDDYSSVTYRWDEDYLHKRYEVLHLKIIHRRRKTGFEERKDIVIHVNDLIAGRYQVTDFLGSAAFSQAVQAIDIKTNALVCLKIIKNNKDYLDQSLDEIKLLKYVNENDPADSHGILQLYDYFYYKEHLFLVCELLRANLYEFQKYNREHGQEPYFVLPRIQSIARQVLRSLAFMHRLDLVHCDLKPENILIKSYSRCEVKVIDLGSSCFTTDHLSSYVQSRSYRCPEVILGLPYNQQADIWSLGCILAELLSGFVLLQNDSMSTLLARMEGILGPVPAWMLKEGRYTHRYYTLSGLHYERNEQTERYEILRPKRTSLKFRVPEADEGCLQFLSSLLTIDPKKRLTAAQALQHPWLQHDYGMDLSK